jgi:hypothetical protein
MHKDYCLPCKQMEGSAGSEAVERKRCRSVFITEKKAVALHWMDISATTSVGVDTTAVCHSAAAAGRVSPT